MKPTKEDAEAMTPEGQSITVQLPPMPAGKRGDVLMAMELAAQAIDPSLVVWHEPMGDRSSLRNLRGIEVKR